MARYTQNSINETAARNNLVDVVSSYVHLKRSGTSYVGLCPFHKEKTPSFHVSEDKQLFYCFGCGESGNIFDFVMKIENLDFVDALKHLASRAGVTLVEERSSYKENEEEKSQKTRILEMNKIAARKFYDNFVNDSEDSPAKEYARRRMLDKNIIIKYGIGYAKDSWDDLLNHLKQAGYSEGEILLAGLAAKNEKGKVYDKFRNRLMFPIIDVRGNIIAFGGRAIGDDPAKYMNSPETPVFSKGRNVFSLNFAKEVSKSEGVILVEGYMDVVSLYQKGIKNAIAGLGTAFTAEQASLIKRYAKCVYVCYDSDDAGQKAAHRAIDILRDAGNDVRVVSFTGAKDPDEYITKCGAQAFCELIKKSQTAIQFKIMSARKNYDLTDMTEKIAFVNETAVILADVENTIERDAYVKSISNETNISESSILSEINKIFFAKNKKEKQKKERIINNVAQESKISSNIAEKQNTNTYKAERMLLNVMFFDEKAFKYTIENADETLFSGDSHRMIFAKILKFKKEIISNAPSEFLVQLDEKIRNAASAILFKSYEGDCLKAAKDSVLKLKSERQKEKIRELAKAGKINEINDILKGGGKLNG